MMMLGRWPFGVRRGAIPAFRSLVAPILFAALAAGCSIPMPETGVLSVEPRLTAEESALLAEGRPRNSSLPRDGRFDVPPPEPGVTLPKAGDSFGMMFRFTPELAEAMSLFFAKDYDKALTALDTAERTAESDMLRYFTSLLRVQLLLITGHSDKQRAAVKDAMALEVALFGNNLDSLSRMAEERLWSHDLEAAEAYYGRVLLPTVDWRLPTLFVLPPLNAKEAGHVWIAQTRSFTGMAGTQILKGDYTAAVDWGLAGEERFLAMIELTRNPLYRLFLKPNAGFYLSHGWNLTMLAGGIAGESRSLDAADKLFDEARRNFAAGFFVDGDLAVDSVRETVAVRSGLMPGRTERIGVLPEPEPGPIDLSALLAADIARPVARESVTLPVPEAGSVSMPAVGERTVYGFAVTPSLSDAFARYLAGDARGAIAALDAAEGETVDDPLQAWYLAYLRAQVLILMGHAADAEESIRDIERLEIPVFGTNLNARALRGEARLWVGDLDGAIADFAKVMRALDGWRLPTLFVFPPPEAPVTVALTRAHFRALMGMAGAHMLKRDYAQAAAWAQRAEEVFTDVFYVVHHPIYKSYAAIDPDLYYVRGVNLGILGAARLAIRKDAGAGADLFAAANAYFDALGYASGRATVDAFRIRALLDIGRADQAAPLAEEAARRAASQGLADAVWRIQAMLGEALLALGRLTEAEAAYRVADAAVTLVSGALTSDRAKRRFGIGKEDITRNLIEFDVAKGDLSQLFIDMERGRARAFVDLLGERPLALGRESERVGRIRALDADIRALRLRNAAPGLASAESVAREHHLLAARRATVADLARRDPEVAELLSVSARSLADVQRRLGPGEALAYMLPSSPGQALRVLLVHPDRARLLTTALTPERLATAVAKFRTSAPYRTANAQRAAARTIADGLGILGWGAASTLYVVPSGPAYFVPWGALDLAFVVAVLPTGGWILRRAHDLDAATAAAVVGDPNMMRPWPQLPGAREEARDVARLYGVEPLIGEQATESRLRAQLGSGGNILHIATHGYFDAAQPMRSGFVLTAAAGRPTGVVTAADIFARPLPARLVVLSACETGVGKAEAGDDFLGLSRSFYLGGVLAILNSLYPVLDAPTHRFMAAFHREARSGDYGRAWLAARDALRAAGEPPSVYGAFVLGGSPHAGPPHAGPTS